MTTPDDVPAFRLAYVPGVTPGKWVRIWAERRRDVALQLVPLDVQSCAEAVRDGHVELAITRLPGALRHGDAGEHHTIDLYDETTVAVVPKDHVLTAADELTLADLDDEPFLWPLDEPVIITERPGRTLDHRPEKTGDAIELVAAGMALVLVPQSLARLHHRKDLTYRPVMDAPKGTVGLLWPSPTTDLADEFIGIVRGRKSTSSRGRSEPTAKRSAKEKAAAKRAAREAAGKVPGKGVRRGAGRPKRR
ncbi:LysR family transcriptional regulator substrate-binding protein [Gordonia sp. ABSL11-1]|uniref:LysR family transcriptional regulator substrate-binding protein n=1 Tax=Gordonia sp. ABSL11-1 TaxID=3053924 RepID=UPI002572C8C2|nr:LysR family transcriptional regulator substrate-binding protein [Gordonia sp. ABSL11-1]MDL9946566.1 LysR family transcriptional regulator substrate-binding protein [Gordonia sp. ABSL11-1]